MVEANPTNSEIKQAIEHAPIRFDPTRSQTDRPTNDEIIEQMELCFEHDQEILMQIK